MAWVWVPRSVKPHPADVTHAAAIKASLKWRKPRSLASRRTILAGRRRNEEFTMRCYSVQGVQGVQEDVQDSFVVASWSACGSSGVMWALFYRLFLRILLIFFFYFPVYTEMGEQLLFTDERVRNDAHHVFITICTFSMPRPRAHTRTHGRTESAVSRQAHSAMT